jgi:hypothetical protein
MLSLSRYSHSSNEIGVVPPLWFQVDSHSRMDVANPTFAEMARHWFDTFGTNPNVESFARFRSWF